MVNTFDDHADKENMVTWGDMAAERNPVTFTYDMTSIINEKGNISLDYIPIEVLWTNEDANNGTMQSVGVLNANLGQVPHKICAPIGTVWPSERRNIKDTYPNFEAWATDRTAQPTFHENPNEAYLYTGNTTGLPLKDAKNKEITASKEFRATKDVMDVEVKFTVDASALRPGTKAVVFEKLLRVSKVHDETVPVELQKHEDINDAAQTITCPVLSTSASISEDKREVTDVISYEGLLPNENYVFRGWLADTVTGEKVPDSDGSVRLSSGKNTSGKTEMKLSADKYEEVKGHSVTAFQELYIIRNVDGKDTEVLVAAHKDKNDKSQIAVICQDIRIRKVVTGNLGDITKRFEYTAEFSGLTPGKAYEIEGDDEKTFIGLAFVKDDCLRVFKNFA